MRLAFAGTLFSCTVIITIVVSLIFSRGYVPSVILEILPGEPDESIQFRIDSKEAPSRRWDYKKPIDREVPQHKGALLLAQP